MHLYRRSNKSNTPPCHQNCAINKFFHLSIDLQEMTLSLCLDLSSAVSPPLPLQTVYRLHLCFHYTALFSIAELKLCLAVCHHSALLLKQPESVNRLLRLILCSGGCKTVMLRKLVDLGNSWQTSHILNIKILQVELEINTNHQPEEIVL